MRVKSADAAAFLHAQFTNDVTGLAVGATQWNGWCSPKGRMLATFPLKRVNEQEFMLVLPGDIAPAVVKRLRMFVLRAKVTVDSLAETHHIIGSTSAIPSVAGVGVEVFDLPDGRRLAIASAASSALLEEALAEDAIAADVRTWDWLAINAGIPVITAATQDLFVPQMLNWELVGGVNFQKGCYPGQEIVARMQYLGKLKERLFRGHLGARHGVNAISLRPGQPLHGSLFGAQSCGTIINVAPALDDGVDFLAVLQVASAEADTIRVGPEADAASIALAPLPYPVPASQRQAQAQAQPQASGPSQPKRSA